MKNSVIKTKESKQIIARKVAGVRALDAIEGWTKGGRVIGLTNGEFSLLSLIEAVLSYTGPANVTISTWSAGLYDASALRSLMACGKILDVKLILDRSFKTRQAGYSVFIQDAFKEENIRTTNTHSKFVLIKNDAYNICIRSSMNLNENKRCENFDMDDDAQIYRFFADFAAQLFDKMPEGIIESRKKVDPIFDSLFGVTDSAPVNSYYKFAE